MILSIPSFVTIFFSNNCSKFFLSFNIDEINTNSSFLYSFFSSSFSKPSFFWTSSEIIFWIISGFLFRIISVLYVFLNILVYISIIFFLSAELRLFWFLYKDRIIELNSEFSIKLLIIIISLVKIKIESKFISNSNGGSFFKSFKMGSIIFSYNSWDTKIFFSIIFIILGK